MSDRKVLLRQLLLLLLGITCVQLDVIAESLPNPCPVGQYYENGNCYPTKPAETPVDNTQVACPNAPLAPTVVAPIAPITPPPCPNAPLAPTVVAPITPNPCPNAPLDPTVVQPTLPGPCQSNCQGSTYNSCQTTCTTKCQTVCPNVCPNVCTNSCPNSCPSNCQNNVPTNCPNNISNNCQNNFQNNNCPNNSCQNNSCQNNNCQNNNCNSNCISPPYPTPPPTVTPPVTFPPLAVTPPATLLPLLPTIAPTTVTPPVTFPPLAVTPPATLLPLLPTIAPTTTTTTYAPPTLTRCPKGTVLIRGRCRLIYCGGYETYIDGKCQTVQCPPGFVWRGHRCSRPEPTDLGTIHLTNILQSSDQKAQLITNNVNNLGVNASIAIEGQASQEEEEEVEVEPPRPPAGPCCQVVAPRVCSTSMDQNGYKCYSRSNQQCGSFCSANRIVLAAPVVSTWMQANVQMMAMPPTWWGNGCQSNGICPPVQNRYDCSGCTVGDSLTCSSYCYFSKCSGHNCAYYDQAQYCAQYSGHIGCRPEDGWFPEANKTS